MYTGADIAFKKKNSPIYLGFYHGIPQHTESYHILKAIPYCYYKCSKARQMLSIHIPVRNILEITIKQCENKH